MELLILNYHYIEDEDKYHGGIYPTDPDRFARHLDFFSGTHRFISEQDLCDALQGTKNLSDKCCLVTFDDALKSQYENALPILKAKKIPAVFFVPTRHLDGQAYTTHKIHYLLATAEPGNLIAEAETLYHKKYGFVINWEKMDNDKIKHCYPFDIVEVARFKYLLNHFIGEEVDELVDTIFSNYFSGAEDQFCLDFYMSEYEIRDLVGNELFSVGLHTHSHKNIVKSSSESLNYDLVKNFKKLNNIVGDQPIRSISYPFGQVDYKLFKDKLADTVSKLKLVYGVTTEHKINEDFSNPFLFGRMDGNKYPELVI